mmetsp:Transcript_770/g.1623  ORF Transcript_770/g.1623 Transcript_770/m.1623 type:complete len:460 (+) Transcript_770:50-1429(+)
MGNEYSYETPTEGQQEAGAEASATEKKEEELEEAPSAVAAAPADPPSDKYADGGDMESPGASEDDAGEGKEMAISESVERSAGDTASLNDADEDGDDEKEKAAHTSGGGGGDSSHAAADVAEVQNSSNHGSARDDTKVENGSTKTDAHAEATDASFKTDEADEEVIRAKALAQFIEKYGAELTPEQIANITPEQIERLSHVGSKAKWAPQHLRTITPRPIVEMREYTLQPMYAHSYLHHTAAKADLRKSLSPLRLFAIPETGGQLNVATHLYHWRGGYSERNARKVDMASSEEWKEYIKKVQPALASQKSTIFMEAGFISEMGDRRVVGLGMGRAESTLYMGGRYSKDAIYEVCRYKLKVGYDVIPQFIEVYSKGLPSKLDAEGSDPSTNLITVMYSTVGVLNEVVEIWRHGGGFDAMERSGAAAQEAKEWRESGSLISDLTTDVTRSVLKPLSFSPLL